MGIRRGEGKERRGEERSHCSCFTKRPLVQFSSVVSYCTSPNCVAVQCSAVRRCACIRLNDAIEIDDFIHCVIDSCKLLYLSRRETGRYRGGEGRRGELGSSEFLLKNPIIYQYGNIPWQHLDRQHPHLANPGYGPGIITNNV